MKMCVDSSIQSQNINIEFNYIKYMALFISSCSKSYYIDKIFKNWYINCLLIIISYINLSYRNYHFI